MQTTQFLQTMNYSVLNNEWTLCPHRRRDVCFRYNVSIVTIQHTVSKSCFYGNLII